MTNELEDFDLFAKNALTNLHWSLDEFYETDYFELITVLNAKEKKERVVDPLELFKSFNH
ncbi:hypothetical protein ACFIUV_08370 [Oenococcus oeni]|uniref:Uncharacterized protein n=1 Tax=Oenococcus oeni AWRIB429 TaxID=655225 RepID=D3LC58_OENOE|nr:hypothetical protein [Oenococcus oeni]EFD87505.1 hypothetical protein AWRIB429_1938 [Oenococcus oeni AWRIB429]EJN93123.1 putative phage protein [Oenococcus oeni AWRIB304]EJO10528.1 putative phage protein [Oenococcus oeni AWRIB576]EJO11253.1 putative phage protein [Oenococcus oeni AWRIB568]KGH55220.1 hypothetical protein X463_07600 [Oenococcus oeni S22]